MKVYICFPEGKAKALTMSYDDGKSRMNAWWKFLINMVSAVPSI